MGGLRAPASIVRFDRNGAGGLVPVALSIFQPVGAILRALPRAGAVPLVFAPPRGWRAVPGLPGPNSGKQCNYARIALVGASAPNPAAAFAW